MGKFLQRSLGVLDRVYDFVGGTRGLSEFELGGSIQPVHDMSREAELGSRGVAQGGYLSLGQTFVHSGVGTLFVATDVYAAFDSIARFSDFRSTAKDQHRLWLLDIFGAVDGTVANWSFSMSAALLAPDDRTQFLAQYDSTQAITVTGAAPLAMTSSVNTPLDRRTYPALWQPGTIWQGRSTATDAVTTRLHTLWWAGPLGTTPPGMR